MNDDQILRDRLRAYCDVNAYDLTALRANLDKPANAVYRDAFRRALAEAAAGRGLTRVEYEALTGDSFDEESEYLADLRLMYRTLFDDAAPD